MISENARVPFLEIARVCNVSGAAIHQRMQKLLNLGVIKGSEYIIDPESIGFDTCAYVGLYLRNPETFDKVIEELKKIPEVVECHVISGRYDLFIKLYAMNNHSLMNVIHQKLQPLGLTSTETLISFNEVFKRQVPIILDED